MGVQSQMTVLDEGQAKFILYEVNYILNPILILTSDNERKKDIVQWSFLVRVSFLINSTYARCQMKENS